MGAVRPVYRDRADLAGARLDQHLGVHVPAGVVGTRVRRQDPVDRVLRGALILRVQGGVDLQVAGGVQRRVSLGVCRVAPHDGQRVVAEERLVRGGPGGASLVQRERRRSKAQRQLLGGVGLRPGDVAKIRHALQHDLSARQSGRRVSERVIGRGILHHPGQQGRLSEVQVQRARAEVTLGRHLDAVGVVVEECSVEVGGEQLVLGHLVLDSGGHPQLAELTGGRVRDRCRLLLLGGRGQDERVLDVLLRERGAALRGVTAQVVGQRADGAPDVERAVQEEPGILDRDDRVAHHWRDLVEAHRHAVKVVRVVVGDQFAVGGKDLRARGDLSQGRHLERVKSVRRVPGDHSSQPDDRNDHGRDEQSGTDRHGREPAGRADPGEAGAAS